MLSKIDLEPHNVPTQHGYEFGHCCPRSPLSTTKRVQAISGEKRRPPACICVEPLPTAHFSVGQHFSRQRSSQPNQPKVIFRMQDLERSCANGDLGRRCTFRAAGIMLDRFRSAKHLFSGGFQGVSRLTVPKCAGEVGRAMDKMETTRTARTFRFAMSPRCPDQAGGTA